MKISDIATDLWLINYIPIALLAHILNDIQPLNKQFNSFGVFCFIMVFSIVMTVCEWRIIKYIKNH